MKNLVILFLLAAAALCSTRSAQAQQLRDMFSKSNPSVVVIRTVERKFTPQMQTGLVSLTGLGSTARF